MQAEWLAVVAVMADLWPHQPVEPATAQAWYPLLADLPAARVVAAVRALALEPDRRWPPSVGELRAAAEPPPAGWQEAWDEIVDQVRTVGAYGRPALADPLAAEWAARRGWAAVCRLDLSDGRVRAAFRDWHTARTQRLAAQRRTAIAAGGERALELGVEVPTLQLEAP